MFNTNDLNFGLYNYRYAINIDNHLINIDGNRMGVLYQYNGSYYDLITDLLVDNEDILMLKEFKVKDTEITHEQVVHIFKSMEKFENFNAIETANIDDQNELSSFIPTSITFRASESNRAISEIFKKEYIDKKPKQRKLGKLPIFKK